jgi:hypothetical protein
MTTVRQLVLAAARASTLLRVKQLVRNALPAFTTTILILRPLAKNVTVAHILLLRLSPAVIVLLDSTTMMATRRLRANFAQREALAT